jgi:hypothetical protein
MQIQVKSSTTTSANDVAWLLFAKEMGRDGPMTPEEQQKFETLQKMIDDPQKMVDGALNGSPVLNYFQVYSPPPPLPPPLCRSVGEVDVQPEPALRGVKDWSPALEANTPTPISRRQKPSGQSIASIAA